MKTIETIEEAVEFYLELLTEKAQSKSYEINGRTVEPTKSIYGAEWGPKFIRITSQYGPQDGKGAHAWVEIETGNVIKSASWKSPQKGKNGLAVRYNLFSEESREKLSERVDPYGGYLYSR
jgi:hypothetical protein